jgi:hypothetical protein
MKLCMLRFGQNTIIKTRDFEVSESMLTVNPFVYDVAFGKGSVLTGNSDEILSQIYKKVYDGILIDMENPNEADIIFAKEQALIATSEAWKVLRKQVGDEMNNDLGEDIVRERTAFDEEAEGIILETIKPYTESEGKEIHEGLTKEE